MPARLFARLCLCALPFLPHAPAAAQTLTLLANGDVSAWEAQKFKEIPPTQYTTRQDAERGRRVLFANSAAAAAGYTRRIKINLQKTPYAHFWWRVDEGLNNPQEKTKAGDDFAFRLYFVGKSGIKYRALNLVYAAAAPTGAQWQSPYGGWLSDIRLHAFANAQESPPGKWRRAVVNVGELWRRAFGEAGEAELAGLMTDSDNTAAAARARYGAFVVSDSPAPPPGF